MPIIKRLVRLIHDVFHFQALMHLPKQILSFDAFSQKIVFSTISMTFT